MNEVFFDLHRGPEEMDLLWSGGWRHFGPMFFRYSETEAEDGAVRHVLPLRIELERFTPSESQRRTLRRNADLTWALGRVELDARRHEMFAAHAGRFRENIPESLETFLGGGVEWDVPCAVRELGVRDVRGRLIAASYVGIGVAAFSSIYGMFDPAESRRRLGIATLLWEIESARAAGCRWLHLGYAYHEPSFYDYKKQFAGLEWFDWSEWRTSALPGP